MCKIKPRGTEVVSEGDCRLSIDQTKGSTRRDLSTGLNSDGRYADDDITVCRLLQYIECQHNPHGSTAHVLW